MAVAFVDQVLFRLFGKQSWMVSALCNYSIAYLDTAVKTHLSQAIYTQRGHKVTFWL